MATALFIILIFSVLSVKGDLGKAKSKLAGKDLFSKSRAINILSFARVFLFGARDIWFVVGVPIFLAEQLGWSFDEIGLFMALWVIGYGCIQALVPRITSKTRDQNSAAHATRFWGLALSTLPLLITAGLVYIPEQSNLILIAGLMVFGAIFAINSSLHSFLIVAISDSDKIALNVGFYYMANAIGRFIGTLLSGLVYQLAGLEACLIISALMLLTAALSASALTKEKPV
jgi:predicted MFS family arabinose efflux permease